MHLCVCNGKNGGGADEGGCLVLGKLQGTNDVGLGRLNGGRKKKKWSWLKEYELIEKWVIPQEPPVKSWEPVGGAENGS